MDTILPAPIIVQFPRQDVPEPRIIYIDSSKNIVVNHLIDTSKHQVAQLYQDSLEDENLTLYYSSVIDGELLQNKLDYKLKIPIRITKTVEVFKPYPVSYCIWKDWEKPERKRKNLIRLGIEKGMAHGARQEWEAGQ